MRPVTMTSSRRAPPASRGPGNNRAPGAPAANNVTPAIPKSQDVKQFIKEPSYCTILQLEQRREEEKARHFEAALSTGQLTQSPQQQQPCFDSRQQMALPPPPIYANLEQSPPPPPPAYPKLEPLNLSEANLATVGGESHASAYASPPSPVSSSYSELRGATKYPPGYHFKLLMEQQQRQREQATYDSLYEPIQGQHQQQQSHGGKSSDEYHLSLNSDSSEGSDYFGLCFACKHKIHGEGTGCTAMGRLFHLHCFTCHVCQSPLQGKPFYALDGKPFCQADYMNTLEKCCKCTSPILDRILRATGKPYHPQCFTCVVCDLSLDGVPFTVDARNRIHCIEDFHRQFAPKCSVCKDPIMPEKGQEETVRVVALDRSFHVGCYRCEDCNLQLTSDEEGRGCYPLDDHVLCKGCNTKRIQELTLAY